jgi:hypothetical protein
MKTQQFVYDGKDLQIVRINPAEEQPLDVTDKVSDHYSDRKVFNYLFIDFAGLFSTANYEKAAHVAAHNTFLSEAAEPAFATLKHLANQPRTLSLEENKTFLDAFRTIYAALNDQYHWMDDDRFIVPLKGGGVITSLFDIPDEKLLALDSKRLPLKKAAWQFWFWHTH